MWDTQFLSMTVSVAELMGTKRGHFISSRQMFPSSSRRSEWAQEGEEKEFQQKLPVYELIISIYKNVIKSYLRNNTDRIEHFLSIMISFQQSKCNSKVQHVM